MRAAGDAALRPHTMPTVWGYATRSHAVVSHMQRHIHAPFRAPACVQNSSPPLRFRAHMLAARGWRRNPGLGGCQRVVWRTAPVD